MLGNIKCSDVSKQSSIATNNYLFFILNKNLIAYQEFMGKNLFKTTIHHVWRFSFFLKKRKNGH